MPELDDILLNDAGEIIACVYRDNGPEGRESHDRPVIIEMTGKMAGRQEGSGKLAEPGREERGNRLNG
jgi:hypothetical protein